MLWFGEKLEKWDDTRLVAEYAKTCSPRYTTVLYKRYAHLVFGACIKYLQSEELAKDAVMAIFEKVLLELKKTEVKNFASWLYSITKNECMMVLRSKKRLGNREKIFYEIYFDENNSEDGLKTNAENDAALTMAIMSLAPEQKQCIELYYYDNKSYKEICDLTGYSDSQVKSYLQNAKRNLKNQLIKQGVENG